MEKNIPQDPTFGEYWHVLLKRKHVVFLSLFVFTVFSVLFTYATKPLYSTSTEVRIDHYDSVLNAISDLFRWSPGNIMPTEMQTIQSPPVIEQAARSLGKITASMTKDDIARAIIAIQGRIKVEQVQDTNMIRITVNSNNPREAAQLANEIANAYKLANRSGQTRESRQASAFVKEQLDKARDQLSKAEDNLRVYRETHKSLSAESEGSYNLARVFNYQSELFRVQAERRSVDDQIESIQRQLSSGTADLESAKVQTTPYISSVQDNLESTRQRIENLLTTRTESNPEVKELAQEKDRLQKKLDSAVRDALNDSLTSLLQKKNDTAARETEIRSLMNTEITDVPEKDILLARLTREVKAADELYQSLSRDLKEARIRETAVVNQVTIVSPAMIPRAPIKPNKGVNILLGVFLGLLVGVVMAALVETTDTSIGAVEDIERLLEVPVLCAIPHFGASPNLFQRMVGRSERKPEPGVGGYRFALPTIFDPSSAAAEAYRTLRANLQFARLESDRKIFMISSSGAQEGKSITVSNLAVVMAQSGMKTILVSCNLRRPSVHRFFGIRRIPGITDILVGSCNPEDAIYSLADIIVGDMEWEQALKLPGIDNLYILPTGTLPPNPTEILDSKRMTDFLNDLKKEYDIILLDSPPVLPVADSLVLGSKADGVVLIYQLGHLPRRALIRTKKQMTALGSNVIGIVINDVRPEFKGVTPIYISNEYMTATRKALEG